MLKAEREKDYSSLLRERGRRAEGSETGKQKVELHREITADVSSQTRLEHQQVFDKQRLLPAVPQSSTGRCWSWWGQW